MLAQCHEETRKAEAQAQPAAPTNVVGPAKARTAEVCASFAGCDAARAQNAGIAQPLQEAAVDL